MSENGNGNEKEKALTLQADLDLEGWGSREDIDAMGRRIRAMMPGGDKMSAGQSMALAQYSIALDANPYRGEVYGFVSRGKFVLVDGYKLLVRWARRQCQYSEKYELLDDLSDDDIGYRCWILRNDALPILHQLTRATATFQEAFEIAAANAVGVVTKADRTTRDGRPIAPPKGWTWDQVARKRALKNALNLSHGAPSPREIAAESWKVNDVQTIADDWEECTPEMLPEAREHLALLHAQARTREPDPRSPDDVLAANGALLHGEQGEMEI